MSVDESLTLQLENTNEAIGPATQTAEAWLDARQLPPNVSYLVSLAIEELVTNCIKYGYDDDGKHTIDIVLSVSDQALTMRVVDDGHPFDPLALTTPDLSQDIEEREIGGLGIHLLKELSDDIQYERHDGTNRLTLIKRFS